jgi:hypothetical protein
MPFIIKEVHVNHDAIEHTDGWHGISFFYGLNVLPDVDKPSGSVQANVFQASQHNPCLAGNLNNGMVWLTRGLHQQVDPGVARDLQLPLRSELGLKINRPTGTPKQIDVATFTLVIHPGAKQQHLALRVNRPQDTGNGLVFCGGQAHGFSGSFLGQSPMHALKARQCQLFGALIHWSRMPVVCATATMGRMS